MKRLVAVLDWIDRPKIQLILFLALAFGCYLSEAYLSACCFAFVCGMLVQKIITDN